MATTGAVSGCRDVASLIGSTHPSSLDIKLGDQRFSTTPGTVAYREFVYSYHIAFEENGRLFSSSVGEGGPRQVHVKLSAGDRSNQMPIGSANKARYRAREDHMDYLMPAGS